MSVENLMERSKDLFSLELIGAGFETDNTLVFEEITRELEVSRKSDNTDSKDGVFDFLTLLADQV